MTSDMSSKQLTLRDPHKSFTANDFVGVRAKDALTELQECAEDVHPKSLSLKSLPDTPSDAKPDTPCGMVGENTKDGAKHVQEDRAQEEAIRNSVEKMALVNKPGATNIEDLLARIDTLEKQQIELQENITTHSKIHDSLEFHSAYLGDRLTNFALCSAPYKYQRNCFISLFKRDKLGTATHNDLCIIVAGDDSVEGGDATVDATLYVGWGGRTDYHSFQKLYGFLPETVLRLEREETIHILNIHAGVLASKHKAGSDKFYRLFAEFVHALEETGDGFEENYLEGEPTDTTRAYWAFLECIKRDVRSV